MTKIKISDLKISSGVGFGTSGIRDLNENLTDKIVYIYTLAFLKLVVEKTIAIAGDRRFSTDRIMMAVTKAVQDSGLNIINCGKIPTPAVAYFGIQNDLPSIMVTGSHIPDDRNGVKFNLASREVLKSDEESIAQMEVEFDDSLFDANGFFINKYQLPDEDIRGRELYIKRYTDFFSKDLLLNKKVGLYGHSAVGREIVEELLIKFGAEVIRFEFSDDKFISVDTDAVNEELITKMHKWDNDYSLDYIVSTDGDGDRPLLTDEDGDFIRAELMPILAGKYLDIESMASTLTACTSVEKSGYFKKIVRTKVGSPYIVEAMMNLEKDGYERVAGYELNGGFLVQTDIVKNGNTISKLPTRDALLPIFSIIAMSIESGRSVKQLVSELPKRYTYSSSIKGIPTDISLDILIRWEEYRSSIENTFGKIVDINLMDGLRITFFNDDIVHFRPSKNAPEFRNYTESETYDRARVLSERANELIKKWTE